jgi:hypothetical protein
MRDGTKTTEPNILAHLPGADSPAAKWFVAQLCHTPRFAHHPTCRCYDNHLIRVGATALCLGCTCLAMGATIAIAILGSLCWQYWTELVAIGTWPFVWLGVALYAPALVQPFVQRKSFKIVSRFLLGVAVPCLWFGAIVLLPRDAWGMVLRGVFLLVFWRTYHITQWFRARYTSSACERCSEGAYPFCRDNRDRMISLLDELQARARPEDHQFVDFAAALAGLNDSVNVEVMSLHTALNTMSK